MIKSYEQIAREAGFSLQQSAMRGDKWYWEDFWRTGDNLFITPDEAWKACCIENGLLDEVQQ